MFGVRFVIPQLKATYLLTYKPGVLSVCDTGYWRHQTSRRVRGDLFDDGSLKLSVGLLVHRRDNADTGAPRPQQPSLEH